MQPKNCDYSGNESMSKQQKLELTWIGKENQPRLEPRILIEDPEKSFGDKNAGNMLIHGDNLLALKALEQDFAIILENDKSILKWLRPAQRQFNIYWKHNSRQYHPDFVAETADAIFIVETKKEGDIEDSDVQEKTQAALQYCKYATGFTTKNSGKPWKYILIPHNAVQANMSFDYLMKTFECEG